MTAEEPAAAVRESLLSGCGEQTLLTEQRLRNLIPPSVLRARLGHLYRKMRYRGFGFPEGALSPACRDFFASDLPRAMPKTVFIVGSGPNGRDHYKEIPEDAYIIALNQSLLIEEIPPPSLWMVCDTRCLQRHWWKRALTVPVARLFGGSVPRFSECRYSFQLYPGLEVWHPAHRRYRPIGSALRVGATVAGCAIQAAYHSGCSSIILCGVDMYGHRYFDDSVGAVDRKHKPWGEELRTMNRLVAELTQRGLAIDSMSETAMDL